MSVVSAARYCEKQAHLNRFFTAEAAVGGPIGLVQDGDVISINVSSKLGQNSSESQRLNFLSRPSVTHWTWRFPQRSSKEDARPGARPHLAWTVGLSGNTRSSSGMPAMVLLLVRPSTSSSSSLHSSLIHVDSRQAPAIISQSPTAMNARYICLVAVFFPSWQAPELRRRVLCQQSRPAGGQLEWPVVLLRRMVALC